MENVKGYTLINAEKVERALNGFQNNKGGIVGGVGKGAYRDGDVWKREDVELSETEVDSLEFALLAEYDKLGGFIKRGEDKVKTGSFYNLKAKKPHDKPVVFFVYKVGNRFVEVPDNVELPGEVKAVKILNEQLAEEKAVKSSKKAKKVMHIN